MKKRTRKSPQRELIVEILKKNGPHMSVEEIFNLSRKKMPKISLGTIYRNLAMLELNKSISSMQGPDNVTFYELYSKPHHHFICESCSEITNLETPGVQMCVKCIEKDNGPKVSQVLTTIYGVCRKCQ